MSSEIRQYIAEAIDSGNWKRAFSLAGELWRTQPFTSTASYLISLQPRFEANVPFWQKSRVAVLRSFTVEPVIPLFRAEAVVHGIGMDMYISGFGEYAQDILRSDSGLYRFSPDIAILAVQIRDIAPELWDGSADCSAVELRMAADRVIGQFRAWIGAFRSFSRSSLIIQLMEHPSVPAAGVLDMQRTDGQTAAIVKVNEQLTAIADETPGVYVLNYESLVARFGKTEWYDERKWLAMRLPLSAKALLPVAREWFRYVYPLSGRMAKVLVTDLDNTLWGGVVGEDGVDGIEIGTEHAGAPYRAVQRALLDAYRRGVLLAICSKNNHHDATRVFEERNGMLLRAEHFACVRANWNDKVENLKEIAAELNVGTDALAFLDDNPAERARVRLEMPEVTVIELSNDPLTYADAVRQEPALGRLSISDEDRVRGRVYAEQRLRAELAASSSTLEDFYHSLEQTVEIRRASVASHGRVAQLTQKTNQFNLTTRRYTVQDIERMDRSASWAIYTLRASDRFGDSGIVGVAIVNTEAADAHIDTFLLSCRVIGRGIETALLAFLIEQYSSSPIRHLKGWYVPTAKNEPAADFYSKHGFKRTLESESGTLWSLCLNDAKVACPPWITLRDTKESLLANYAHN